MNPRYHLDGDIFQSAWEWHAWFWNKLFTFNAVWTNEQVQPCISQAKELFLVLITDFDFFKLKTIECKHNVAKHIYYD